MATLPNENLGIGPLMAVTGNPWQYIDYANAGKPIDKSFMDTVYKAAANSIAAGTGGYAWTGGGYSSDVMQKIGANAGNTQRAPSYTEPANQTQTKPISIGGQTYPMTFNPLMTEYGGTRMGIYGQGMYPYQNYGRQGMYGYNNPRNNFSFGNSLMFSPYMGMNRQPNTANASSSQWSFQGLNGRGLL